MNPTLSTFDALMVKAETAGTLFLAVFKAGEKATDARQHRSDVQDSALLATGKLIAELDVAACTSLEERKAFALRHSAKLPKHIRVTVEGESTARKTHPSRNTAKTARSRWWKVRDEYPGWRAMRDALMADKPLPVSLRDALASMRPEVTPAQKAAQSIARAVQDGKYSHEDFSKALRMALRPKVEKVEKAA